MEVSLEVILTIVALSFWFLFPIGMFLSVSQLDKNTEALVASKTQEKVKPVLKQQKRSFDWHHPIFYFRRWLNE